MAIAPTEPTARTVVANGLHHRILEWDGGGDTTVLCLHGFLDLSWAFAPIAPALAAAGHHVVAPDLRGHGDTERVGPGGYYYFTDYVLDVADLVDVLARDGLAIVGHSMGGGIAALYAATFPARPRRIAILEGIHLQAAAEDLPGRMRRWIADVRLARVRPPKVYPSLDAAAARLREHDPRCPPEIARGLAEHGTIPVGGGRAFKHDPLHVTRGPHPFRLAEAKRFWSAIDCPVLLVDGAESEIPAPPDLHERVAAFRDARRVVLPGAGHMMIRHQPEALARLLLDFLAGA